MTVSGCRRRRKRNPALRNRGHLATTIAIVLGVWWTRTRLCEGRRPGSNPGEDIFCRVETQSTSEPDGTAAACKAALSGFDSHRRLFEGLLRWCRPSSGARASRVRDERDRGSAPCVPDMGSKRSSPISVSSVGRAPDLGLAVAGSTPVPSTKALGW
jgi:hypothetical protein